MKSTSTFGLGLLLGLAVGAAPMLATHLHHALHQAKTTSSASSADRAHTETKFSFVAHAPMDQVAPLFGAYKERVWSPGWDPQFLHPSPAADIPGMVFTVPHAHFHVPWVNTEFDPKNGRVQYVYVIPDILITVITLRLTPDGNTTKVDVEYDRTALTPDGDAHVQHMAEGDRSAGADWDKDVNAYLRSDHKVDVN
jgi:hypothetical protein